MKLNTHVFATISSILIWLAEAQVYNRIWDITQTPVACRNVTQFYPFMTCMMKNLSRCNRIATFTGTNSATARLNMSLPFAWNAGTTCAFSPRFSEILTRRTRFKTATLNYSVVLPEAYDNIGFLKLPGLAGVRSNRSDLFDWVRLSVSNANQTLT